MTSLYRHFNAEGDLLYVGISGNALIRLGEHKFYSPWYDEIEFVSIEHFPDRTSAREAELRAISIECPLHNRDRPRSKKGQFGPVGDIQALYSFWQKQFHDEWECLTDAQKADFLAWCAGPIHQPRRILCLAETLGR